MCLYIHFSEVQYERYTYIWSQGVGYGMASRLGDGSLTNTSPRQVTDQMACLDGGLWIPLESQHDTLNNASWAGREVETHRVGKKKHNKMISTNMCGKDINMTIHCSY